MKNIKGNIIDLEKNRIFSGEIFIDSGKIIQIEEKKVNTQKYILPGWIDAHVHIESSMLTPARFAQACVRHGTVANVSDPHEIANVIGVEGVEYMINNGEDVPVKYYFGAPSCVPATPMETSGAILTAGDVEKLLARKEIRYLSEMMNFPGVIHGDPDVLAKLEASRKYNKPVDGHAPGLTGKELNNYISAGISTDHEAFKLEEGREKIGLGMKILIREGSAARNFNTLIPLLREAPEKIMFCSDDLHPDDLLKGHINLLVMRAVAMGYDLFDVLRAASMNAAKHYGLDVGLLKEGDPADFIVVGNLKDFPVEQVFIEGKCVFENGRTSFQGGAGKHVNQFNRKSISEENIVVPAGKGKIHVIGAVEGELYTKQLELNPKIEHTKMVSDPSRDIMKLVLINRYKDIPPAVGFVQGFGLKNGAFGSSISHDSHNILVTGVIDSDIVEVANAIIRNKGGLAVKGPHGLQMLPLPVAGLMSDKDINFVADKYQEINKIVHEMGCRLKAPVMTLSFMSLLVIPQLKLGDKGYFNVEKFSYIPVFSEFPGQ